MTVYVEAPYTKRFPIYASHFDAHCFECGHDLDGRPMASPFGRKGDGEFSQNCSRCRMSTWYDLAEGPDTFVWPKGYKP